jgi:fructosamine-3-kinase
MFEAESKGLSLLRQANCFRIPEFITYGEEGKYQFLLLEFITSTSKRKDYWRVFGQNLAKLHLHTNTQFGLDHDNYIGSLQQNNKPQTNGVDFFIAQRLNIQLKVAIENKLIERTVQVQFENLFQKLPSLLPEEKPSLIHGDLWSGNVMVDDRGDPCLIDPAVCYNNREADLAMTTLFGGFDLRYIAAYEEVYPLAPGFEKRLDLYNLYPLLVHLNLFGRSYAHKVVSIVTQFV